MLARLADMGLLSAKYKVAAIDYEIATTLVPPAPEVIFKVPRNLEETFVFLDRDMSKEDHAAFMNSAFDDITMWHMNFGMWIRNRWGLWSGSELSNYMRYLGFTHPDDMSTAIMEAYWSKVHNVPYDLEKKVKLYKDFWNKNS